MASSAESTGKMGGGLTARPLPPLLFEEVGAPETRDYARIAAFWRQSRRRRR
jgi:hypothetical protein